MKQFRIVALIATSITILSVSAWADTCVTQTTATHTCREFNTKVSFNGEYANQDGGNGVACLQSDGLWKVVSGPGFGSSFMRSDNLEVAYIGAGYYVNGVYYQQPTKIRYILTRKSVCVPAMPAFLQSPSDWQGRQIQQPVPLPNPQTTSPVVPPSSVTRSSPATQQ